MLYTLVFYTCNTCGKCMCVCTCMCVFAHMCVCVCVCVSECVCDVTLCAAYGALEKHKVPIQHLHFSAASARRVTTLQTPVTRPLPVRDASYILIPRRRCVCVMYSILISQCVCVIYSILIHHCVCDVEHTQSIMCVCDIHYTNTPLCV